MADSQVPFGLPAATGTINDPAGSAQVTKRGL